MEEEEFICATNGEIVQKILLSGAKFILAEEKRVGMSGKQRVRLIRSESIRPAGAARA